MEKNDFHNRSLFSGRMPEGTVKASRRWPTNFVVKSFTAASFSVSWHHSNNFLAARSASAATDEPVANERSRKVSSIAQDKTGATEEEDDELAIVYIYVDNYASGSEPT